MAHANLAKRLDRVRVWHDSTHTDDGLSSRPSASSSPTASAIARGWGRPIWRPSSSTWPSIATRTDRPAGLPTAGRVRRARTDGAGRRISQRLGSASDRSPIRSARPAGWVARFCLGHGLGRTTPRCDPALTILQRSQKKPNSLSTEGYNLRIMPVSRIKKDRRPPPCRDGRTRSATTIQPNGCVSSR
jgi:hypothetical protein